MRSLRLCSVFFCSFFMVLIMTTTATKHIAADDDLFIKGIEQDLERVQNDHEIIQELVQITMGSSSSSSSTSKLVRRQALVELGDIYFYGNKTLMTNVNGTLALNFYAKAAENGAPRGQFHLGVAYAYGFWGFPKNEALSILNYYFASLGRDLNAIMVMGHKHLYGIGSPKNCESAMRYYEFVANKAVELREANPNKPFLYDISHRRLKNLAETQHKKNTPSDAEIVDYYQYSSEKGDPEATMNLAFLYYYGVRGLEQDLFKAAKLFQRAYELGATGAASNLGHIYAFGIGVEQNYEIAHKFLQEATKEGNAAAQNELGVMYLHGKGDIKQNQEQAYMYFKAAAKAGHSEAFYNLGVLNLQGIGNKDPEYEVAQGYFQVAAHQGHTLSTHKLAHMIYHGIGTTKSCPTAVEYMKIVAERGEWDRLMAQAFREFKEEKKYTQAFHKYVVLAQQGYEIAQHNAAWMLENGFGYTSISSLFDPQKKQKEKKNVVAISALQFYKLAALQGNVDANLKIGDFYYYGKEQKTKTNKEEEINFMKAIAHYSLASKRQNAQAMFNLGYMYEHGIGMKQDFYLAKRYFDKAKEAHMDAKVPVFLALLKLKFHVKFLYWYRRLEILLGWREASDLLDDSMTTLAPQHHGHLGHGGSSGNKDDLNQSSFFDLSQYGYLEKIVLQWKQTYEKLEKSILGFVTTKFSTSRSTSGSTSGGSSSATFGGFSIDWSSLMIENSDNLVIMGLLVTLLLVTYVRVQRERRLG